MRELVYAFKHLVYFSFKRNPFSDRSVLVIYWYQKMLDAKNNDIYQDWAEMASLFIFLMLKSGAIL